MERDKAYSSGKVADMVGVPKYKLRDWCDRYLPHIQKFDIGQDLVQVGEVLSPNDKTGEVVVGRLAAEGCVWEANGGADSRPFPFFFFEAANQLS